MDAGKSEVVMSDDRSGLDSWLETVIMLSTGGTATSRCCYGSTTMASERPFLFGCVIGPLLAIWFPLKPADADL